MNELTKKCISNFNVVNNNLMINGISLLDITKKIGTPCYIYSEKIIEERLKLLRSAFPKDIKLNYSVKANPFIDILSFLENKINGFDVASEEELLLAISTKIDKANITLTGPGKTDSLLEKAILNKIIINVESVSELNKIILISKFKQIEPHIILRINPSFPFHNSGMRMSGCTQFGLDEPNLFKAINVIKQNHSEIIFHGFHIFNGSQNLNQTSLINTYNSSIELMLNLLNTIEFDNCYLGSSLGIPYFEKDEELDIQFIGSHLDLLIKKLKQKHSKMKLHMELGRYIIGSAGLYVSKIITKKDNNGHVFLITDGGMNHNLAACGLLGQLIRKNYPIAIGNNIYSEELKKVTISGPLCTPLDILGKDVILPIAEEEDLVVVFQSGAYGLTASPNSFLSHKVAKEILF